ncbi:MAG: DUF3185 domain-containing protein [candidate division Zixibacteria bacterium]|nr:DUF3185 domain-containing protein [candidate division Zixibacteria bacterium]
MKPIAIVGIVLIVLGAAGLVYGGITYTHTKNVVDMGPLQVNVDDKEHIPVPPIAGGVASAIGIVFLFVGRRGLPRGRTV